MGDGQRKEDCRVLPDIRAGAEIIRKIAIACNDLGIEALTCYAFSTENWKRPEEEDEIICANCQNYFFIVTSLS